MGFKYTKVTAEQAAKRSFSLVPDGEYNFQTLSFEDAYTKESGDFLKLKHLFWDNEGKEFYVFDNLMGTEKMGWKTRHYCESVGLEKEYENDEFDGYHCPGRMGKALITTQKSTKKDDGSFYPDKNVVKDYIPASEDQKKLNKVMGAKEKDLLEDDIDF